MAAQSWIENYSQDQKSFLFHRSELKAELRENKEAQSKQISFIFKYIEPAKPEPESEVSEKEEIQKDKLEVNEIAVDGSNKFTNFSGKVSESQKLCF